MSCADCLCIPTFFTDNHRVATCVRSLVRRDKTTLRSVHRRFFSSRVRYLSSSDLGALLRILQCLPNLEDLDLFTFLPPLGLYDEPCEPPRVSLRMLTVHLPGNIWNDEGDVDLSLVVANILTAFARIDRFTITADRADNEDAFYFIYSYLQGFTPSTRQLLPSHIRTLKIAYAPPEFVRALSQIDPGTVESLEISEMDTVALLDFNTFVRHHPRLVHLTCKMLSFSRAYDFVGRHTLIAHASSDADDGVPSGPRYINLSHCTSLQTLNFVDGTTPGRSMSLLNASVISFLSETLASLPSPSVVEKVEVDTRWWSKDHPIPILDAEVINVNRKALERGR